MPKGENDIICQEKFSQWIESNLLLEIVTLEETIIVGRMLNYLEHEKMILVCDVDHKNVFNINLYEINQINPSE